MNRPEPSQAGLLVAGSSLLLVVDAQERLAAAVPDIEAVVGTTRFLLDVASLIGVPTIATEQHPEGLGPTIATLRSGLGLIIPKLAFSALKEPVVLERILELNIEGRRQVVICGLEAHICVLQTAVDLIKRGSDVAIVADGVGSRRTHDRDIAFDRLARHGAQIVTADMVVYEWLERAGSDLFRRVLPLVRGRG
ncbi:isochorismatase family protein [Agaricicola taiwanensis]|uniref:isochorismatase family protein n=1 Tax=Agaricicola taiwanensis TaxID=591372 RepID=UPI00166499CE